MQYTLSNLIQGNRLHNDAVSKQVFTEFFKQAEEIAPEYHAFIPCLTADRSIGATIRLPVLGTGIILDSRMMENRLQLIVMISGAEFVNPGIVHNVFQLIFDSSGNYEVIGKTGVIEFAGKQHKVANTIRITSKLKDHTSNPRITGSAYLVYVALRWYDFDSIPEITTAALLQPKILSWENFNENH